MQRLAAIGKASKNDRNECFASINEMWNLKLLVTDRPFCRRGAATRLATWGTAEADNEGVCCGVAASGMCMRFAVSRSWRRPWCMYKARTKAWNILWCVGMLVPLQARAICNAYRSLSGLQLWSSRIPYPVFAMKGSGQSQGSPSFSIWFFMRESVLLLVPIAGISYLFSVCRWSQAVAKVIFRVSPGEGWGPRGRQIKRQCCYQTEYGI